MTKGRAPVSLCKCFTLTRLLQGGSCWSTCPEGASQEWDCATVALNMLSLEEDKIKQSSDDALRVLTSLLVSSLARSG